MTLAKKYKAVRAEHDVAVRAEDAVGSNAIGGLNEWNRRWVGEEGYQGMVARQMQAFKKAQREREAALAADLAVAETAAASTAAGAAADKSGDA